MGQRRREPARRVRREPDRERLLVPRELPARRRHALAAGPRRGPVGEVPVRRRTTTSGDLWSLSPAPVLGVVRVVRVPSRPRVHDVRDVRARESRPSGRSSATRRRRPRSGACRCATCSGRPRRLRLWAFLEWCCGVAPSPRREFGKLFLETRFDAARRRGRRPEPHVGRAVRAVRALEHELPVRERVRDVRSRRLGAGRQGGVPGRGTEASAPPRRCSGRRGRPRSDGTRTRSRRSRSRSSSRPARRGRSGSSLASAASGGGGGRSRGPFHPGRGERPGARGGDRGVARAPLGAPRWRRATRRSTRS